MSKDDAEILFEIALRSFAPDAAKYGAYPPLMNMDKQRFKPPRMFGKTLLVEDVIIGGAFVVPLGSIGEIGAVFLDPKQQGKGYGRQTMQAIEERYPKVKKWKLDTPSESPKLHAFYESCGYVRSGERAYPKDNLTAFVYEKRISQANT